MKWCWRNSNFVWYVLILTGVLIRWWQIGQVPSGLYSDEVAISYDAWGISENGRDWHNKSWPIVFESLGDYKTPLFIYLVAGITKLVGPHDFTIRILSQILATSWVVVVSRLTKKPLMAFALLISYPAAITLSRVGFEVNLALLLIFSGIYMWKNGGKKVKIMGFVCMGISTYAYHSAKVIVLLISTLWLKISKANLRNWVIGLSLVGFISLPGLIWGSKRLLQTSDLVSMGLSFKFIIQSLGAFNLSFLFFGTGDHLRHVTVPFGLVSPLWILLIPALKNKSNQVHLKFWLGLLAIGFIPALITNLPSHSLRLAIILPALVIVMLKATNEIKNWFGWLWLTQLTLFAIVYFGPYRVASEGVFNASYRSEIVQAAKSMTPTSKFYISSALDNPLIYVLWYWRVSPKAFNEGGGGNIRLTDPQLLTKDFEVK